MTNIYNPQHPHEPGIPPALDPEGRCLVCALLVERDESLARLATAEVERRRLADGLYSVFWRHYDELDEASPNDREAMSLALQVRREAVARREQP